MSTPGRIGWAAAWRDLVSAAVLGTDRRPLPPLPAGPLRDLLDGREAAVPLDDATRLLDRAAALAAARRAGRLLDPPPPPLPDCPPDDRPPCPPAATRRLAEILETWPALVDEWLLALLDGGFRLPPEHAVRLLADSRADPARRALVERAAGPLAGWLVDRFPRQLAARRPPGSAAPPPGAPPAGELPSDLSDLLGRSPEALTEAVVDGLRERRFVARHRPLLITFVGRLDPAALAALVDGLGRLDEPAAALLAGDLAALARTRLALRDDLRPADPRPLDAERGP